MVKISLEFPTVDAAIVALGKLASVAAVAPAEKKQATPLIPTVVAKEIVAKNSGRKPRADKGKERGPYKTVGAGGNTEASQEPAASPPTPETAAPAQASSLSSVTNQSAIPEGTSGADKAAAPTEAEAQTALSKVFEKFGLPACQLLLKDHGVSRMRDLPAEKRAAFIAAAEARVK